MKTRVVNKGEVWSQTVWDLNLASVIHPYGTYGFFNILYHAVQQLFLRASVSLSVKWV